MACYHPLIRVESYERVRAQDGHFYNKARIVSPENFELENLKDTAFHSSQIIPCGKCIGCRLDYSREWANRGYLESTLWKQNWFCTITYDEEHMSTNEWVEDENGYTYTNDGSWNGTLVPKDLTRFIKNVRQIMKREYNQENIRFMACGEYGAEGERPHYHIIFFNLDLPVEDLYKPRIINNELYYQSHIIERAWGKGICNISEANWSTIAYTARYITKKVNGKESSMYYASKGQEKEFLRVSRMPGIGEGYYQKHWKSIYKNDEIIIVNRKGVQKAKPPRYFDELFKKDHPKEFKKLQRRRKREGENGNRLKDMNTSLSRQERLEIEEREKDEQTMSLIRYYEAQKS